MGWQKTYLEHSYISRCGPTYVVGMYTNPIIDLVVYNMNCKIYEFKPKDEKGEEEGKGVIQMNLNKTMSKYELLYFQG